MILVVLFGHFFMSQKSQTTKILAHFFKNVQNQFDAFVKMVRTNNGGEFISNSCQALFIELGILHQKSWYTLPIKMVEWKGDIENY